MKKVWESYKPQWGISGLKKTGIVPLNPECIQETNFRLSEPFHTSNEPSTSHQDLTLPLINQHHSSPPNLNTSSTSDDQLSHNLVPSNSHPSTHPYTTQLPNETSLINDLPSTLNQQPPSSIFIPSTPNSPQTSPVTESVTDHLNSSSDIRLNAVEIVSSDGLRDFFAKLLESQTQRKNGRKRLTGLGESLTSDEAMEIMRKEEEEKRKKRKELRMKKKEEKMKKNGKGKRGRPKKPKTNNDDGDDDENEDNDITPMNCPACKGSYHDEKVWLECEFCHAMLTVLGTLDGPSVGDIFLFLMYISLTTTHIHTHLNLYSSLNMYKHFTFNYL